VTVFDVPIGNVLNVLGVEILMPSLVWRLGQRLSNGMGNGIARQGNTEISHGCGPSP